jgi:hypothetical protein
LREYARDDCETERTGDDTDVAWRQSRRENTVEACNDVECWQVIPGQEESIGMAGSARRRLPRAIVAAVDESKILGIRAGSRSDHRFIGIWAVVVDGRVFARSWMLKSDGWHRTFLEDSAGTMQVRDRSVRIRAVPVRSERVRDAVEQAYAEKYPTPGSRKYVRGFKTARRRDSTMEFVPR